MAKSIGFVKDIRRSDGQVFVTVALVHEEVEQEAPLLGELVRVKSGRKDRKGRTIEYLGMVVNARYSPIAHTEYARDLALTRLNEESLDRTAKEQINFMEFDIALLGLFDREQIKKLNPGVRFMPSLVGAEVLRLDEKEAGDLLALQFGTHSGEEKPPVVFGHLAYGTDPEGERQGALKYVSASLFQSNRTANFGKTGTGKSNENKIIITLLAHYYPETAFLIFDANGEYAVSGAAETEMGLAEAFKQLDILGRLVLFSNKQFPDEFLKRFEGYLQVRPAKVNFYQYPEIAIALVYRRSQETDPKPPQYLEEAYNSVDEWKTTPNRQAYLFGAFRALGFQPPAGFSVKYSNQTYYLDNNDQWNELREKLDAGAGGDGSSRKLYLYRSRLAFLKPLHTHEVGQDIFAAVKKELLTNRKIVVLDMPSLGDLAEFIANRLAANLFEEALELNNQGQKANFVILIEEAHRYLADKTNAFYKIAKEGRKFGIGMIYSTQSPRDVPDEILSQTENFLVKHVSSAEDIKCLVKSKAPFESVKDFLLFEPAVGFTYFYSDQGQPFPVSLKVRLFSKVVAELRLKKAGKELQGLSDEERAELEKFVPQLLDATTGIYTARLKEVVGKIGSPGIQPFINALRELGLSQVLKDLGMS
ncbi:MAG: ATP-binding protein, partial [Candidatus Hadarchaeum sp.]|uniref:ATP-binding protein n=1 Tax=Candidatus Hadarchaeum sp. TaxID=2883567 RepID=UPI003D0C589C